MIQKMFGNAKKVWFSDDILGTGNNTWRSDDNWFSILLEVCIMRGTRVSKFMIKLIIRVVFWCGHQGLNWFRYLQAMFCILAIKPGCSWGSLHAHVSAFFQSLAHLWRLEIAHCSQMKLSHTAQVNNQGSFQNVWVQFKLGCDMQSLYWFEVLLSKRLAQLYGSPLETICPDVTTISASSSNKSMREKSGLGWRHVLRFIPATLGSTWTVSSSSLTTRTCADPGLAGVDFELPVIASATYARLYFCGQKQYRENETVKEIN